MKNKRQVCPDCRAITCTKCQLPWEEAHEDISCDQFKEWKEANDPDNQAKGLEKHLDEHGIQVRLTVESPGVVAIHIRPVQYPPG